MMQHIPTLHKQYFHTTTGFKLEYSLLSPLLSKSCNRPIVLIIGWTGVKEDWLQLSHSLSTDRSVLVFDNRGMGGSDIGTSPYTMRAMCDDCVELIAHCFGEHARVHLFGISMGGMIAQCVARYHPWYIDTLILGCTTANPKYKPTPAQTQVTTSAHNEKQEEPSIFDLVASLPTQPLSPAEARLFVIAMLRLNYSKTWLNAHPDLFEELITHAMSYNRSAQGRNYQLHAITQFQGVEDLQRFTSLHIPILLIHGQVDRVLPYYHTDLLAAHLPAADVVTLPDDGHCFWISNTKQTATCIQTFIYTQEQRKQKDIHNKQHNIDVHAHTPVFDKYKNIQTSIASKL